MRSMQCRYRYLIYIYIRSLFNSEFSCELWVLGTCADYIIIHKHVPILHMHVQSTKAKAGSRAHAPSRAPCASVCTFSCMNVKEVLGAHIDTRTHGRLRVLQGARRIIGSIKRLTNRTGVRRSAMRSKRTKGTSRRQKRCALC